MMDKTITTHTLQSRFDKKSGRGMPGKKITIAHSGQVIDYFVLIIPKPHPLILSLGF